MSTRRDSPEPEHFPQAVLEIALPIIASVAPAIALLYPSWPPEVFAALVAIGFLTIVWFGWLYLKSIRKLTHPTAQAAFVSAVLRTGRIPPPTTQTAARAPAGRILVLHLSDSRDLARDIVRAADPSQVILQLEDLVLAPGGCIAPQLHQPLASALGLLLVWSSTLQSESNALKEIEAWAIHNTHKAIIVVIQRPEDLAQYSLPYHTVLASDTPRAVAILLQRASERGQDWRIAALAFRALLLTAGLASLLALTAAFVHASGATRRIAPIHQTLQGKLSECLDGLEKAGDTSDDVPGRSREAEAALNAYCAFIKQELETKGVIASSDNAVVTAWRYLPDRSIITQIGRSEGTPKRYFLYQDGSLIAAAFRDNYSMLSSKGSLPFSSAAWNSDGEVRGRVGLDEQIAYLDSDGKRRYHRLGEVIPDSHDQAKPILTYLIVTQSTQGGTISGLSVHVPVPRPCLGNAWVRRLLYDRIMLIQTVPDDWINVTGKVQALMRQ